MTDGEKIAKAAESYIGTPHVNGAKVKGAGIDCGMLLIASLEDAGIIKKDSIKVAPYSNEWHLHHSDEWFLSYVRKYCKKAAVEDAKPGDFFMYQYGRCISHAGVYIGDGIIVHAVVDEGVIMSNINEIMFLDAHGHSRLRGVYRFKGVKE